MLYDLRSPVTEEEAQQRQWEQTPHYLNLAGLRSCVRNCATDSRHSRVKTNQAALMSDSPSLLCARGLPMPSADAATWGPARCLLDLADNGWA